MGIWWATSSTLTIAWVQGHFQETFTQHDQDLTNDNPGEDGTGTGINNWLYTWYDPNSYLLSYLNGQPLGGTGDGIVLWYFGSTHHEPTDADNQMGNGGRTGITLVHWLGFEMVPHNFFDYNPLGGPPRCGAAEILTMRSSWVCTNTNRECPSELTLRELRGLTRIAPPSLEKGRCPTLRMIRPSRVNDSDFRPKRWRAHQPETHQ